MKILFICGSLEPGKDGVGDYTRILASELVNKGHKIAIVALNDEVKKVLNEQQCCLDTYIDVLRIPKHFKWNVKINNIKDLLKTLNPDLLSLQYVPYSFHLKGIPLRLPKKLYEISGKAKWHIMFHELWLEDNDIKSRLYRFIQKKIISDLKVWLMPILVHTHVPCYSRRLRELNIISSPLLLFSNIPVSCVEKNIAGEKQKIVVGFFSQVTYRDKIEALLLSLKHKCEDENRQFEIRLIGGGKTTINNFLMSIKNKELIKNVKVTGFLYENEVSKNIAECDFGITPVPYHLLGKSGSAAAFLAHGIPLAAPYIKPGFEDETIGIYLPQELQDAILVKPNSYEQIENAAKASRRCISVINQSVIAHKFISDFKVLID